MSTLHIHANATAPATEPRGARWAAAGYVALWQRVERVLQRRSGAARRAVADANRVRRVAEQHQRSDPRFAQDLFAAADRHERLHG